MRSLLLLLLAACLGSNLKAQELKRRSFLGIQMENLTADLKRIMELDDTAGVLINGIVPGSTAEAAGFKRGDILLKINGTPITTTSQAVGYVGSQRSGSDFTYEILRDKKKLKGKLTFKAYPQEAYPDLDVIYTQAATNLGLQRLIVTRQKAKANQPLVFFIGGIGCYSLDSPLDSMRSETQLLNKLARAGYTTVRLEKSGVGDGAGAGKPCNEIGFMEEAENYARSIGELAKRKEFATDKVYIIGHSMGGVMAPVIASQTEVDGIIAYGTIGSNFIEYLLKTRRTVGEAYAWAPEETDAFIKDACECANYYFAEKMTTAQVAQKKPICAEHVPVFDLRARKYNDELYALNIPGAWKSYNGTALLVWGGSDFIASKEDHEIIANTVNRYHSGNASFVTVERTDHGMNSAATFQEAQSNPGGYNPLVGDLFLDWLKKQS